MLTKYVHRNITWVDLESPTENEIKEVTKEFGINLIVAEELRMPTIKSKVDLYSNCIFLTLHFPVVLKKEPRKNASQEIDFVVGKNFIITTRYETLDPLHRFSKIFEVQSALDKSDIGEHAGFVFYYMIEKLYESLDSELEVIRDGISDSEEKIFGGRETEMVIQLSRLTRTLLDFKRALLLHREVLHSFELAGKKFFGEEFTHKLRGVIDEYFRIAESVDAGLELVGELRNTNNSLVTTKQNETIKVLTVVAVLTLPMSLITNFFQLTTAHTPIVGRPHDWLIITAGTIGITVLLFIFGKIKKWY